jgi:nucleoside-diphosphate-sugar epimerase
VIHLAGLAHARSARAAEHFRVNAEGTRRLAQQAAAAGVRRLVFASSVKVHGEATPAGAAWTEESPCAPQGGYACSKWAAEQALLEVAAHGGLEVVALRLPLLYGPGVRANLERLFRAVAAGRPLPFGALQNRRSLLAAANGADALLLAARHPAAAGRVVLARDADYSTPELVRAIARALGTPAKLWKVPPALLALLPLRRLTSSLVVDDRALRDTLGWSPPYAPDAEWARTAAAFRGHSASPPLAP